MLDLLCFGGKMTGHDEQRTSPALVICSPCDIETGHLGHVVIGQKNIGFMNVFQGFMRASKGYDGKTLRPQA